MTELAGNFTVSRSAISQHLGVLAEAGLVASRREGRFQHYRLKPEGMTALRLMATTTAVLKPALARQARAALVMDTTDTSFDSAGVRREFGSLPVTDVRSALKELLTAHPPGA